MKVYGYCRISTGKQNIERQIRNIKTEYPEAFIVEEVYTGTKISGREMWQKLMKYVQKGDKIVFDSVSRMSRDAKEGFASYEELFCRGIDIVFLKEPHINTSVYKKAIQTGITMTGTNVDFILDGVNKYLMALAEEQIKLAFEQAEKEVRDLHQRTVEGIEIARLNGKQIGRAKGTKIEYESTKRKKQDIYKYSADFNGTLRDKEVIKLLGICRNSYYKYKREIKNELKWKKESYMSCKQKSLL